MSARVCRAYVQIRETMTEKEKGAFLLLTGIAKDIVTMLACATSEDFTMMRKSCVKLAQLGVFSGASPHVDQLLLGIERILDEYEEHKKNGTTFAIDTDCLVIANGGMDLASIRAEFAREDSMAPAYSNKLN